MSRRRRPVRLQHLVTTGGLAVTVTATTDACTGTSSGGGDGTSTGFYASAIAAAPSPTGGTGVYPIAASPGCWSLCSDVAAQDPNQPKACAYPLPNSGVATVGGGATWNACCPAALSSNPNAEGCGTPAADICPPLCSAAQAVDPNVVKQCSNPTAASGVQAYTGLTSAGCCPPAAAADPNLQCP